MTNISEIIKFILSDESNMKEYITKYNPCLYDSFINMLWEEANIFVSVKPNLTVNNGGTVKDGTAYKLSGHYYFEIAIYNTNKNLVKLIYSNDIKEIEPYTSVTDAKIGAIMYIINNNKFLMYE